MKKLLMPVAALFAGTLFATTVVYTNAYTDTAQWGHEGNWTNSAGEVVALAPTNGEDIAFGPLESIATEWSRKKASVTNKIWPLVTVSTGKAKNSSTREYPAVDPTVGFVGGVDTERYTVNHTEFTTSDKYLQPSSRTMTIDDASGFLGFWTTQAPKATFKLPQGGGMSALSTTARPFVNVPTANTKVTVDKLYGSGAVNKTGDGTLAVNSFGGGEVKVFVEAGTLELTGEGETTLSDLLGRAALHLDASDDSTLVKTNTDAYGVVDGRTYITRWYDVRRNGKYAEKSSYTSPTSATNVRYPNWPFVSAATSDTGLPLVDFGRSLVNPADTTSPTNCCMVLSERIAGREFFGVMSFPSGACGASIAGDVTRGEHPFMCISNTGYPHRIFNQQYASPALWNGDIAVNGIKRLWSQAYIGTDEFRDVFVMSCGALDPVYIDMLGSDSYHKERTGNVRFGEILVYTNVLTHSERAMVNAYLNRRWRRDGRSGNLSAAVMKNSTKISVPEGRTAKVEDVALLDTVSSGNPNSDETLRKEGDGTLVIGRLHPAGAKIAVSGGKVEFAGPAPVGTSAPAADPALWLDASSASSLVTNVADGVAQVETWRDCRAEYASSRKGVSQGSGRASVVAAGCNGLDALDFGPASSALGAWMRLTLQYAKAVFIVMKQKQRGLTYFGSSSMDFYPASGYILSTSYAQQYTPGAMWTIDGTPTDPWIQTVGSYTKMISGYHVVGFSCSEDADVWNLASDRGNSTGGGGVYIGEAIYYDRELTPAERRQTEAYLMKKWLNEDHPANTAQTVSSMTVAAGEPIRLGTDGQLTIASISGGDGSLEKDGSGDVVVNATVPISCDVAVNGGSLTIPGEFDWNAAALYRFDASDLSTLVTNDTVNGVTQVVSWSDPRGNGKTANACIDASLSPAYPTLQTVETRNGVTRTVVDFGAFSEDGGTIDPTSAAMRMNCTNKILTALCIFADAHDSKKATIFSSLATTGTDALTRGSSGQFVAPDGATPASCSVARNSNYFLDGSTANWNTVPSAGYHLAGVNIPDKWTTTYYQSVSAFANQLKIHSGGICVGEAVGFKSRLTTAERDFVSAVLMKKWFDTGTPTWTTTVRSLSLANGASFDMTGAYANLVVTNFAGSGSVGVASAEIVDSLSFEWRAENDHDSVAFSGSLSIADGATVSVSLAAGAKFAPGKPYTLVSAGALEADVSTMTLVTDIPEKFSPGLMKVGDSIVLTSLRQGFSLIVW